VNQNKKIHAMKEEKNKTETPSTQMYKNTANLLTDMVS